MDGEVQITTVNEPYEEIFNGYIKNDKIVSKDEYYKKDGLRAILNAQEKHVPIVEVPMVEEVPEMTRLDIVHRFYELRMVNRNVEASELLTEDCVVSPPIGFDIKTKVKVLEYWESKKLEDQPDLKMEDPVELRAENLVTRRVSMVKFFMTITMIMKFSFREDGKIQMIKVSKA